MILATKLFEGDKKKYWLGVELFLFFGELVLSVVFSLGPPLYEDLSVCFSVALMRFSVPLCFSLKTCSSFSKLFQTIKTFQTI